MPGLTPSGFEAKTLQTILDEIRADLRSRISPNINLETTSPTGQLVGVMAGQLRKLWELAEAVYNGQYPDSASGFSLTALAVLTGTQREAATPSEVLCTVNVDAGTYAPGDLVAHVSGDPTARFVNVDTVTNAGPGAASVVGVRFQSEDTGPIRANAGTLTVIAEAVAGWNSVTNPADATLGALEESDTALRTRREQELARRGSTTVDAIRVDVLDVDGVTSVAVLENDTEVTNGDGLPAKSVEALVLGGTDAAVAEAVFRAKPAGIRAYGTTTVTVTDDQGVDHSVGFTRPSTVNIWVIVNLTADTATYAGGTAVEEALVDWGDQNLAVGDDVVWARLLATVMGVGGVRDVTSLLVGTVNPPVSSANVAITARQLADLDTSRITVNATLV